ncbi:hypothetical protein SAMN04489724_4700 [Algoriphagus locisalis]|uniref:Uncharacterized protein n=1 Tax=Algoriphagus locisalis TaxID=305507 RepID=A0A1I7E1I3_9BACT|nr:hypothetical protein [Algoriphagus locisalis]SFU17776.1 hypothetical protein SAMN04489724_4700 [Algoriphagus locisalis]
MRKLIFGLLILIPVLMSCEEDEDKVIQTDLPTEANELFKISKAWNESLYFAMISWEEYQQLDSLNLPNCPMIKIDQDSREVTLDFLPSTACVQSGEYGRSGKLIMTFDSTVISPNRKWSMHYEDYLFGTDSIKGIRNFSSDDSLLVSEEFSEVIEKTEKELTTEFSGNFTHTKSYDGDSLVSFSSVGKIVGKNPAGRNFEIILDSPVEHAISCYQQNEIIPRFGKENWVVSRGGTSEVRYSTSYESLIDSCKVAVNTTLPDGRKLLLNPTQ